MSVRRSVGHAFVCLFGFCFFGRPKTNENEQNKASSEKTVKTANDVSRVYEFNEVKDTSKFIWLFLLFFQFVLFGF